MLRLIIIALISVGTLLATAGQAFAISTLYQTLPDYFSMSSSTMVSAAVGSPCAVMTSIRFNLPCNPAFISVDRRKGRNSYAAQLYVGSGASEIKKIQKLLDRNTSPEFLQELFRDPRLQTEMNVQMTLRGKFFGASLVPERLTYASVVRNQAYPVVAIAAMRERSAVVQGGVEVWENLYAGLQARVVDRQFVSSEFSLFDALAQGGDSLLAVHGQTAVYLEPGIGWLLRDDGWRPRASLQVGNIGVANQSYASAPMRPEVDVGFGVAPPVGMGDLELAVNYHSAEESNGLVDPVRIATSYSVGLLQAVLGIGKKNQSVGIVSSVGLVRTGITLSNTLIAEADGSTARSQTIFTEFGVVF